MIDFTSCIRDYSRTYRGASGKKICVIYEGERYLLKFPPPRCLLYATGT